jgi:exodeoxyribonuclease VII large subunit
VLMRIERGCTVLDGRQAALQGAVQRRSQRQHDRLHRAELRLQLLDPKLVLQRGYALLTDEHGGVVRSAAQTRPGQPLRAALAEGEVDLTVAQPRLL